MNHKSAHSASSFRQERVGRHGRPFTLVKFRTMHVDTASVASHLASSASITRFGHFLRRTKLDERRTRGVLDARPGTTGLAQVNEIDMSTLDLLAETDARMLASLSVGHYFKYIFMTVAGRGSGDRVK